jgi:hypothetical protein
MVLFGFDLPGEEMIVKPATAGRTVKRKEVVFILWLL